MDYSVIDRYIDRLIDDTTPDKPVWNIENIKHGKPAGWNYIDGCMMTSLYTIYQQTGKKKYLDFIDKFVDYYVFDDGAIRGYDLETYNVDNLNEGRVLFDLYRETGKPKYKKAIELLYSQIKGQPRTVTGNFWHKKIYPEQVWLDGLYMAQVFYTRYEAEFNGGKNFGDIVKQFQSVYVNLYDKEKRLYYHGWDSSKKSFWCDKNGLSKSFWLRAIGWYTVGLADTIGYMDRSRPKTLVIEDTGIGISQEDLPRIFEKGFTGYNGRENKKSTGIGLYLCKTIMDKLRHGIWLESEVGKGTKAYIDLGRRDGLI